MKMSLHSTGQRLAALVAAPLVAGALVAAPHAAQAAPNSYAYSAARWLDDQLTNGLVRNPNFGGFDDYGLSIDVFFTLHQLDTRSAAQDKIIGALAENVDNYTTGGSFGPDDRYAGATGKLASAVEAADQDPTSFGGVNLIQRTEDRVQSSGRATDLSDFGDYSNTIGQAWVVRALNGASSELTDETAAYLLKQQCANGEFRINLADTQCATPGEDDVLSIDATALAVQALEQLPAATPGRTAAIDKAVQYLASAQAADGSYSDDGTPNTNTTGLAAATLKLAGRPGAAGAAAAWIVDKQVTDATGEDTKLANELGAIAYNVDALSAGKADGITDATRDQWIRATAQAAAGVNAQLPAAALTVAGSTTFVQAGTSVKLTVSGLAAGEPYTVSGLTAPAGRADSAGKASITVKAPSTTGQTTVTVKGARAQRSGSVTLRVLAAKKLTTNVRYASIAAGKTQTYAIRGLASGESVTLSLDGRKIRTGKASTGGVLTGTFTNGVTGKRTLKAVGQFSNRTGSKTFTVTKK